jgi:hypothetical protein
MPEEVQVLPRPEELITGKKEAGKPLGAVW